MIDYNKLHWQSDWNGYEVGFDNVPVVGCYSMKEYPIEMYIDIEKEEILQMWIADYDSDSDFWEGMIYERDEEEMDKGRGFQKISMRQFNKDFKEFEDATYDDISLPKRATMDSAGYDFFAPFEIILQPGESIKIPTGIKAYMKSLQGEVLMIYPRSSHGFKKFSRLANTVGIVDADYHNNIGNEGHIFIKIRNEGTEEHVIKKGEAFAQGMFSTYLVADDDNATEERIGGIGSSD